MNVMGVLYPGGRVPSGLDLAFVHARQGVFGVWRDLL